MRPGGTRSAKRKSIESACPSNLTVTRSLSALVESQSLERKAACVQQAVCTVSPPALQCHGGGDRAVSGSVIRFRTTCRYCVDARVKIADCSAVGACHTVITQQQTGRSTHARIIIIRRVKRTHTHTHTHTPMMTALHTAHTHTTPRKLQPSKRGFRFPCVKYQRYPHTEVTGLRPPQWGCRWSFKPKRNTNFRDFQTGSFPQLINTQTS